MATITISLHSGEAAPRIDMLTDDEAGPFLIVRLGDDVSLFLPGYNAEAADCARALGHALIAAADQMPIPPVVAAVEPQQELTADQAAQALGAFVAGKVEGA